MHILNLPPCQVALEKRRDKVYIYDDIRSKWVALTPEEWVRQHFVHYLVIHLGYPSMLINNEVGITIGKVRKRIDTVIYDKKLSPQVLIEYKAPNVKLSDNAVQQIIRYNYTLKCPILIISNGMEHIAYSIDYISRTYSTLDSIPNYKDLQQQ